MLNFSELYPVSNEIRQAQLLDGLWRFQFDPQEAGDREQWALSGLPAPISMPVPASFADVFTEAWQRDYCGDFWYETDVYAQDIRPGQRYFIRFGSVTHRCKVYINGVLAAEHEGGFLPVAAEVTALLRPGRNLLSVKANNELNETSIPCGAVLRRADGSKQAAGYFDFFNYSGIHRSVWLVRTPEEAIQDYDLTYRLAENRAFIDYSVDAEGEYAVCVELRDRDGALVAAGEGRKGELTVENGLRKQAEKTDHLGLNESIPAVCFPVACAMAASFDRALLRRMGEAMGDQCQHEQVGVNLGPAINIKRSPLCGRNFEYMSEDPYLAGELAVSLIQGVQSKNVGVSVKHFAANNQEHRRMSSDSVVDERTLREIYLPAFEAAAKRGHAWTFMCSYNKLNGEYASQHKWLLTDLLRKEWGFDGYVMSDWGAVSDRVKGVEAGLDLEMPSSNGERDRAVMKAVQEGRLDEKYVDQAVERILDVNLRYLNHAKPETPWDKETDHVLAGRAAAECMVLLKNEDGILPLKKEEKVAVIGEFAAKPRYQGGGSSHINSFKVTSLLDALADEQNITYAQGYAIKSEETDDTLLAQAVEAAKNADKAVVVAGLPDSFESEGYDRTHMRMPENQVALIEAVAKANPNTVVLLYNGSPVEMPWIDCVKGVIEGYLGGQNVGFASRAVLYGDMARAYAQAGAKVAALDLNEEAVKKLADEMKAQGYICEGYKANVLDPAALEEVHQQILKDLGPCDILVNDAGGNNPRATTDNEYQHEAKEGQKTFFDLDASGVDFVFKLNFQGTLLPTQTFAKDMVERKHGCILNISSMNAYIPLTKIPAYSRAKAAISNFTQWLATHFAGSGIRANAIAPGFLVSNQNRALLFNPDGTPTARSEKILKGTPMGRFVDSEELLGGVFFLTDDKAASAITGVVLPIDCGFAAYSGV